MKWWGYHRDHGWVVLDRTVERNRPGSLHDRIIFVRCRDGVAFEAARSSWNPPEFVFAPNHLEGLPGGLREVAAAELREYQQQADGYHRVAQQHVAHISQNAQLERADEERRRAEYTSRLFAQPKQRESERWALAEVGQQRILDEDRRKRALHFESLRAHLLDGQRAEADRIRQRLREREIKTLVHFTRAENLASIISRGLLPRISLQEGDFVANDDARVDGMPEASCLSVSFPNYRMFYRYRKQNEGANWGVLQLSTEVLLEKPCLFLPTNAASSLGRDALSRSLNRIIGTCGLEGMFEESPNVTRLDRGLAADLTTDPQAEVLILDAVEPDYFRSVALLRSDPNLACTIAQSRPGLTITLGGPYFKPRLDYHWWRPSEASCNSGTDDELDFL